MVVLKGGLFLMSEVPLYEIHGLLPRGNPSLDSVLTMIEGYLAYEKLPPRRTLQ